MWFTKYIFYGFIGTINDLNSELIGVLSSGYIQIIVTAVLAYWFGVRKYFIQRSHEQFIKRYLESGLDVLVVNIEHALEVFSANYAHGIRVLKNFKSKAKYLNQISKEDYSKQFVRYRRDAFHLTPVYKLQTLIGKENGEKFWKMVQYLFAFLDETSNFFEDDLYFAFKNYESLNPTMSIDEVCKIYLEAIKGYNENIKKFYILLCQLQNIALLIEANPFSFKDIKKIKQMQCIQEYTQKLTPYIEEIEKKDNQPKDKIRDKINKQ